MRSRTVERGLRARAHGVGHRMSAISRMMYFRRLAAPSTSNRVHRSAPVATAGRAGHTATPSPVYKQHHFSNSRESRFRPVPRRRYIKMRHYSYPLNDERERLLDRLEAETDANTRAEAVDAAIRHYLEYKQFREEHWEEFDPGTLKLLNTSEWKVAYFPKVQ